jgi:hypothetical protein
MVQMDARTFTLTPTFQPPNPYPRPPNPPTVTVTPNPNPNFNPNPSLPPTRSRWSSGAVLWWPSCSTRPPPLGAPAWSEHAVPAAAWHRMLRTGLPSRSLSLSDRPGSGTASWLPTARGALAHAHGGPLCPRERSPLATWVVEQRLQRRPAACPNSSMMPPSPLAIQVRRPPAHLPTGGLAAAAAAAAGRDRGRLPQRPVRGGEDGGVRRARREGRQHMRHGAHAEGSSVVCAQCSPWGWARALEKIVFLRCFGKHTTLLCGPER